MKKIILYGLGGCGKTTVAKALHRKTGRAAYDVDYEVYALTGKTPAEIVMHEGISSFRAYEKTVVKALAEKTDCVISVGAGTLLDSENCSLLKKDGYFVYLNRVEPSESEKETDAFFLSLADKILGDSALDAEMLGVKIEALLT